MSNYVKIVKTSTKHGIGGSFNVKASFVLDNIKMPFVNTLVKIDTGCSISVIPLGKYKLLRNLKMLKSTDILNGVYCMESYGVESGGKTHPKLITYQDKMNSPALKFEHTITNFEIDGVKINYNKIYVNYDRSSHILIGMDILENWDIHMGKDDVGQYIFLGCPYDQINDGYLEELENTFHIASNINASAIKQKL